MALPISQVSPQALTGLTGLEAPAPKPATGKADGSNPAKARPPIGGPLSGLAPSVAKPRTSPTGAGPRPLGMPAQRLKIKGLPSARAGGSSAHAPTPPTSASQGAPIHATRNLDATDTPAEPASEHPVDVGGAIAASQQAALDTILMQSAMSQIQNEVSISQALNSIREETGKSVKALSQ